jgi:hypothetical protein
MDCSYKPGIYVLSASYGRSCRYFRPTLPLVNSFEEGNATGTVANSCDGKAECNFPVDVTVLGDPASGCAKDFSLKYLCRPDKVAHTLNVPAEANGKTISLACPETPESKFDAPRERQPLANHE